MTRASWVAVIAVSVGAGVAVLFLGGMFLLGALRTQTFSISSGSMAPTLMVGDRVSISRTGYGTPDAPAPRRGDVVVYRHPRTGTDYVHRVVGLPGERVQMRAGRLYINDTQVSRERVTDFTTTDSTGSIMRVAQFAEALPGGVSHRILEISDNAPLDNTDTFTVPAGNYFMMGDNRDNSLDSRVSGVPGGVGFVPFANLRGPIVDVQRATSSVGTAK